METSTTVDSSRKEGSTSIVSLSLADRLEQDDVKERVKELLKPETLLGEVKEDELEIYMVVKIEGVRYLESGYDDDYDEEYWEVDRECTPTIHVKKEKMGGDFVALSHTYGEKGEDGKFSIGCTIVDDDVPEFTFTSTAPERAIQIIDKGLEMLPRGLPVWSDRVNTVCIRAKHKSEDADRHHRSLINSMFRLYLLKPTLSELVLWSSPEYSTRGWIQQEIFNPRLVILCAWFPAEPLRSVIRVLQIRPVEGHSIWKSFTSWAVGIEPYNSELFNDKCKVEGDCSDYDSFRESVRKVRDFLNDTIKMEWGDGPEWNLLYNFILLRCLMMEEEYTLIPYSNSLHLLLLRHHVQERSRPLVFDVMRCEDPIPGEGKHVCCLRETCDVDTILDLKRYNLANLMTEFTNEGDRHIALYNGIESLSGLKVEDRDKVPDLKDVFVTRKGLRKVVDFVCGNGKDQMEVRLSGEGEGNSGVTLFVLSCGMRDWDIAKKLSDSGCDVKQLNSLHQNVMMIAAQFGDLDHVKVFIDKGIEVNHQDSFGRSSLILASREGHSSVVKELIKAKSSIDHQTDKGITALDWAIMTERKECYQILKESGANTNSVKWSGDKNSWIHPWNGKEIRDQDLR
mmetsp:Transcript_29674/g.46507  ORF Transcript_29674/g.46507 Transcript_29674/m.46507 type:complete len:624 (-) Transcript_29674:152-2023(-)